MNKKKNSIKTIILIAALALFSACNNFFHDLIPPKGDRIISFEIDGQEGPAAIGDNSIDIAAGYGAAVHALVPRVRVSHKATLIPVTLDYVSAAFPSANLTKEAVNLYTAQNFPEYVMGLIKRNPDFNVPALTMPIDFSTPVIFFVISGQGDIRQYTVKVAADTGLPQFKGIRFPKYDNSELVKDALCFVNESTKTIVAAASYPAEMDSLSFALVPSYEILGSSVEVDGVPIVSGQTAIQFSPGFGMQTKTITVKRGENEADYMLTVYFSEDMDTIRSITDFRFTREKNPGIAANAVASIVNSGNTGSITVQVFYSGAKPSALVPHFITPGDVTVEGAPQASGITSHDFSDVKEYRVVSRNGLYSRNYTVKTEYISISNSAPRINAFKFSQSINPDIVQESEGAISDGLIMIDIHYNGAFAPDTLIPEFSADGIVSAYGSVQVSGASAQDFSRQILYTVSNPENPLLKRDYWVKARLVRDRSSDAKINSFGFYPADNPGLTDEIHASIDQASGKIMVYAPVGSGLSARTMFPRFSAEGTVSVDGAVQSSGVTGMVFNASVTYTVVSANGTNRKNYVVDVRELQSRIYVDQNAVGLNDGTSWQDAFISLKTACETAALFPEDVPKEIWIARGTYKPGTAREDYFPLTANTSYYGGFRGWETSASQRNVPANPVIISGDLGGGLRSSNLFGAYIGGGLYKTINGNLTFDGLSFSGARALKNIYTGNGSAIDVQFSGNNHLSIANCTFSDLRLEENDGGAVHALCLDGDITISDTYFYVCSTELYYTAVLDLVGDSIVLERVTIDALGNMFESGAAYIRGNDVALTEVEVRNGDCNFYGFYGFINFINCELVTIKDCVFEQLFGGYCIYFSGKDGSNMDIDGLTVKDVDLGGGIFFPPSDNSRVVRITNSTFQNLAKAGGVHDIYGCAIYIYDSYSVPYTLVDIKDSLFENITANYPDSDFPGYGYAFYGDKNQFSIDSSNTFINCGP